MNRRWPFDPIDAILIIRLGLPITDVGHSSLDGGHACEGAGATLSNIGRYLGCTRESVSKYRRLGLNDVTAERLALELGVEPVNLWPDWYNVPLGLPLQPEEARCG